VFCPVLGSPVREADGHTEANPAQDHSDGYRTRASLLREEAERAGAVHPGEEKAPRDLANVHKYLMGGRDEDEAERLFPVVPTEKTRGNEHKRNKKKLNLNTRKHFFTARETEQWHRLPREVVESPSLEVFKSQLDTVLVNLL